MGRKKLPNPKGKHYKRPCATCGTPCYGRRCRGCSFNVLPVAARVGPSREAHRHSTLLTTMVPAGSSWWTEANFAAAYQRELPRLMAVKVSGTQQVNVVLD